MTPDGLFLLLVFGLALLASTLSPRGRLLAGALTIALVFFIAWAQSQDRPHQVTTRLEITT